MKRGGFQTPQPAPPLFEIQALRLWALWGTIQSLCLGVLRNRLRVVAGVSHVMKEVPFQNVFAIPMPPNVAADGPEHWHFPVMLPRRLFWGPLDHGG